MELVPPPIDLGMIARGARGGDPARAAARLEAAPDRKALRQAAQDFEAVFLAQMLAPMFDTLESDTLTGGGPGEEIYRSMMVEEYGKAIARSGGVGIAGHVETELLRIQEAAAK